MAALVITGAPDILAVSLSVTVTVAVSLIVTLSLLALFMLIVNVSELSATKSPMIVMVTFSDSAAVPSKVTVCELNAT